MKFLVDEDVPVEIIEKLGKIGHDAIRVVPSSSDPENANRAKSEGRVLISLDKDLTNRSLYPPKENNIIHVQIHPPLADTVMDAINNMLAIIPPERIKGLIVLTKSGPIVFTE